MKKSFFCIDEGKNTWESIKKGKKEIPVGRKQQAD